MMSRCSDVVVAATFPSLASVPGWQSGGRQIPESSANADMDLAERSGHGRRSGLEDLDGSRRRGCGVFGKPGMDRSGRLAKLRPLPHGHRFKDGAAGRLPEYPRNRAGKGAQTAGDMSNIIGRNALIHRLVMPRDFSTPGANARRLAFPRGRGRHSQAAALARGDRASWPIADPAGPESAWPGARGVRSEPDK